VLGPAGHGGRPAVAQGELGIADAEETGTTFVENAMLKARHACALSGLPALADDSGLDRRRARRRARSDLGRYAGVHGDADAQYRKLLAELHGVPEAERTRRALPLRRSC
jgi:XTP/dITP diphosphohydrolase